MKVEKWQAINEFIVNDRLSASCVRMLELKIYSENTLPKFLNMQLVAPTQAKDYV